MKEDFKSTALSFAKNPVEVGIKGAKHGISRAGKLLSKAKEHGASLYQKASENPGTVAKVAAGTALASGAALAAKKLRDRSRSKQGYH